MLEDGVLSDKPEKWMKRHLRGLAFVERKAQ